MEKVKDLLNKGSKMMKNSKEEMEKKKTIKQFLTHKPIDLVKLRSF
jgi:hypothetical protein